MRYPSLQSDGTSSFSQISVKRGYNSSTDVSMSVVGASAGMSSYPVALLLFKCFMVLLISSLVGLSELMGKFTITGCISRGSSVAGLFSISSNCSFPLLSCCSIPVMFLSCLSLTCRSGFLYLPANFLVVSYSCLTFPLYAACSASFARLWCNFVCPF